MHLLKLNINMGQEIKHVLYFLFMIMELITHNEEELNDDMKLGWL